MEQHKCTGCGVCCSCLLPVSKNEIRIIRKYIKQHKIKPLHNLGMLDCPFFDSNKSEHKCLIYPVRPWICKVFYCDFIEAGRAGLMQARTPVNMQEIFPAVS